MSNNISILYVEDEPDIRSIFEFALEDEGFDLTICEHADAALTCAPTLTPDLMVLDVMMPGMDGPSLLTALREFKHLENTPVIFMTAKVQPAEKQSYLDMGAIGVISKPFEAMTLANEIKTLLVKLK